MEKETVNINNAGTPVKECDIAVIGGGPAGLAAAAAAYDAGGGKIFVLERDLKPGGILNQCIHNGFGLARFKESLSGPEYAERFIREVKKRDIQLMTGTTVLSLKKDRTLTVLNSEEGVFEVKAKAVILAMGCRERSRGSINVPGTRPAGVYSAGTAQRYVNVTGYLPGKRVVILGSGDIGLIMARRMTLEGAKVLAVCEVMPHPGGLKRNIIQCLEDFNIPLYLKHTITKIEGEKRVEAVEISEVDDNRRPIKGTEFRIECDTVLFSVGLVPENELTIKAGIELSPRTKGAVVYQNRETLADGIFACGNTLQVHDLVDYVSDESEIAGRCAAEYVKNPPLPHDSLSVANGGGISYVVPQRIDRNLKGNVKLFFRVTEKAKDCLIKVTCGEETVLERKKKSVAPGEMETLILQEKTVSGLKGDIKVELYKAE